MKFFILPVVIEETMDTVELNTVKTIHKASTIVQRAYGHTTFKVSVKKTVSDTLDLRRIEESIPVVKPPLLVPSINRAFLPLLYFQIFLRSQFPQRIMGPDFVIFDDPVVSNLSNL